MKIIRLLFIPVLGDTKEVMVEASTSRPYEACKTAMAAFIADDIEHVAVLYDRQRRDMFVGGNSSINGVHIRNVRATEIYRNNMLSRDPTIDPESMPAVSGPAVLVPDVIIWT